MVKRLDKKNAEGYLDLTPYRALSTDSSTLDQEDAKRMEEALKTAKRTFYVYGFEVVGALCCGMCAPGKYISKEAMS